MKPSIYENYKENNVGGYTSKKNKKEDKCSLTQQPQP
jgi:hypothetical protein